MKIRLSQTVPLVLLCIAAWMLAHPYQGIFHDAHLYTLQALAHLHPESLGRDVFLRFGSQDRFTLFSPLYAATIQLLGVDHAAALLTLIFQAAVLVTAWYLARTVTSPFLALLGVAMLIVIPGNYGPDRIFACVEPFITPRMGAEACAVAAVTAAFRGHRILSGVFLIAGVALHPVMAAAGAVMLFMSYVVGSRPITAVLLASFGVAWLVLSAFSFPLGEWGRLEADWLELASRRSPFLFLSHWQLDDWGRASIVLATLVIGSCSKVASARQLCRSAALTMVAGIALTGVACDLLHLTLVTQMQPWRWEWLATFAAAVTVPFIAVSNWNRSAAGRVTALLLIAAWIFGSGAPALITSLVALLSLRFERLQKRELMLVLWGSCIVLAVALVWYVASDLQFSQVHYLDASLPLWYRRATSFALDGVTPAIVIGFAAWILTTRRATVGAWGCAALAIAAVAILWNPTSKTWLYQEFPQPLADKFAAWRDIIAPSSEVFWGESPVSSWVVLNRPNYISGIQSAGMIFTRASALEFQRRALSLSSVIAPANFLTWNNAGAHLSLSPEALHGICRLGAFDYLVTSADLGMQPVALVDRLKLYACTAQARAAAAAT